VARLRSGVATSAGGVVHRAGQDGRELVIGRRRRERLGVSWSLPKGTPVEGETLEETALREVTEETGLAVEISGALGGISYSFVRDGVRIAKTVHYFLMVPTGGDLSAHDHEFDEVRWVTFAQAASMLTFETERALVERAADRLDASTVPSA
jgi:8-oxo-dGTP pyrophosphatase MutT (NUDIX family)